jgi:hypothetical protein
MVKVGVNMSAVEKRSDASALLPCFTRRLMLLTVLAESAPNAGSQ